MKVGERAAGDVSEHLLHDGVAAVLSFGLGELERRVGEDRVVPPDREPLVPAGRRLSCSGRRTLRTMRRAVTAWPFFGSNAVYSVSATSASEIQQCSWSSRPLAGTGSAPGSLREFLLWCGLVLRQALSFQLKAMPVS
jgi:hypothetical protein